MEAWHNTYEIAAICAGETEVVGKTSALARFILRKNPNGWEYARAGYRFAQTSTSQTARSVGR
jgi:hypothetical protein